ncbi:MAG TPA: class I SAM-dependent methyltransferase [Roseiflexaceae bacterium]|nr:class I SAM-dependent methyltransferase [Roseiflexaceae bacterium]
MDIYQGYAPFYDGSGQIRFALLMAQYLEELLRRHPAGPPHHPRRALDLACGTGTLAVALAESGWRVVGLDQSAAMLALARAKAEAAGIASSVTFVQGDMRDFNAACTMHHGIDDSAGCMVHAAFDLVTCTYDSLNYLLTEDDLARCFRSVARALAPGGLFVADMNTRHFLEHDWPPCEVDERPGFVQVARSHFDPARATSTLQLTGFAGDDERGYERFDELHIERAYPPETVAALLEAAGLCIEAAYDCFTFQPHHPRSQRIAWVASKPGGRTED